MYEGGSGVKGSSLTGGWAPASFFFSQGATYLGKVNLEGHAHESFVFSHSPFAVCKV